MERSIVPGLSITHIGARHGEEELDDIVIENNSNNDKLESYNGDDCDDIILKQAIQESLKEVKNKKYLIIVLSWKRQKKDYKKLAKNIKNYINKYINKLF